MQQVVEEIDVGDPQQRVPVLRDRDEAARSNQRADEPKHPNREIDDTEDQANGLYERSIPHCITPARELDSWYGRSIRYAFAISSR